MLYIKPLSYILIGKDMRQKNIICKECKIKIPANQIEEMIKNIKEKYGFEFHFYFCPICGHAYPKTLNLLSSYFDLIQLDKNLYHCKKITIKSELLAAVREAVICFEHIVRELSGLYNLEGQGLMSEAFSFEYDQKENKILKEPKIPVVSIKALQTKTGRNKQEGIKFLSMGLMTGIRNIIIHHKGEEGAPCAIHIINLVDFLMKHLPTTKYAC